MLLSAHLPVTRSEEFDCFKARIFVLVWSACVVGGFPPLMELVIAWCRSRSPFTEGEHLSIISITPLQRKHPCYLPASKSPYLVAFNQPRAKQPGSHAAAGNSFLDAEE